MFRNLQNLLCFNGDCMVEGVGWRLLSLQESCSLSFEQAETVTCTLVRLVRHACLSIRHSINHSEVSNRSTPDTVFLLLLPIWYQQLQKKQEYSFRNYTVICETRCIGGGRVLMDAINNALVVGLHPHSHVQDRYLPARLREMVSRTDLNQFA